MPPLSSFQPLTYRLRSHKRRWAWLLTLCWLFVNAQLAVAGHQCDFPLANAPTAMQHQAHLHRQAAQNHDAHMDASAHATSLCEKHCVPDNLQPDNASLALLALPVDYQLAPVAPSQSAAAQDSAWLTPPSAGPPAEIRFCRFRE
ncbi:hypothetical protein FJU30_11310 [Affinibrenneria salicis]|uniref:DUF2946 domain-containing protein n=1 Tax=Affinibrenneria salicis TaxID=2590031 RepID=A0A5J5G004_9GAMM|nr:hypothetical protein [Affinibrenneria salicis]KAA8999881.1 hypothetical protein FJU30_11310 [Affinibrenneria salicis]